MRVRLHVRASAKPQNNVKYDNKIVVKYTSCGNYPQTGWGKPGKR